MTNSRCLWFEPFRLELGNECLWRGAQAIPLTPTAFALLRYLAERPGQLVTKDELLKAVWPEAIVSEGVLTTHIGVLRQTLGDAAKAPQYIETVHRRGYRFLPSITTPPPVVSGQFSVVSTDKAIIQNPQLATGNWQLTTKLVGRETELTQLHGWLDKALNGERQLAFVTGEAGIGKTTVVEAFLSEIRQQETGNREEENQKSKGKGQK
jgi:DNA-binding winged helix-turn-helix (wHTH) protein